MTERELDAIVGSGTKALCDARRHAILLRAFRGQPEYDALRAEILARRERWLEWQTVTQRKWQTQTRRPARAKHHDSVAIREKYVRVQS